MSSWTWTYGGGADQAPPPGSFPSQADAEAWLSECWEDLAQAGVTEVTLMADADVVYGPMSLSPAP